MRRIRVTGLITPVAAEVFRRDLEASKGSPIQILFNSEGGDVKSGLDMYQMLLDYPGKTTGIIESLAASMASVIILGCDRVEMLPDTRFMIHPPETLPGIAFDERDTADNLTARAEWLRSVEAQLLSIYMQSAKGLTEEALKALWTKEPYLTPKEAIELGFADAEISAIPDAQSVARVSLKANAPKQLARMVAQARGKTKMNEEELKALKAELGLDESASAADVMSALAALKASSEETPPKEEEKEEEEFADAVAKLPAKFQAKVLSLMSGSSESTSELLAKVPENLRAFASKLSPVALKEYVSAANHSGARPAKASTSATSVGKGVKTDEELRRLAKVQAKAGLGREDDIFNLLKKNGGK